MQNPNSPPSATSIPPTCCSSARKRGGRPTKYSAPVIHALCQSIELGCSLTEATAVAGISMDTLGRWRERYPHLQMDLEQAEARGIQRRLEVISAAAENDPKWAAWILEHRWPERWSRANRGQVQIHVDQPSRLTLLDKSTCEQISASWQRFVASRTSLSAEEGPEDGALPAATLSADPEA